MDVEFVMHLRGCNLMHFIVPCMWCDMIVVIAPWWSWYWVTLTALLNDWNRL